MSGKRTKSPLTVIIEDLGSVDPNNPFRKTLASGTNNDGPYFPQKLTEKESHSYDNSAAILELQKPTFCKSAIKTEVYKWLFTI